jgi:hypothetical protein
MAITHFVQRRIEKERGGTKVNDGCGVLIVTNARESDCGVLVVTAGEGHEARTAAAVVRCFGLDLQIRLLQSTPPDSPYWSFDKLMEVLQAYLEEPRKYSDLKDKLLTVIAAIVSRKEPDFRCTGFVTAMKASLVAPDAMRQVFLGLDDAHNRCCLSTARDIIRFLRSKNRFPRDPELIALAQRICPVGSFN